MTTTTEAINSASWTEEDDEFVLASLLPLVLLLLLKFVSLTSLTLLVQNEKSESEREKLFWFSVPCWRWWWSCGRGSSGVESVCVCVQCRMLVVCCWLGWMKRERRIDCWDAFISYHHTTAPLVQLLHACNKNSYFYLNLYAIVC